ncbi:hypothetical protein ACFL6C_07190 [Myxococcota bacterium]
MKRWVPMVVGVTCIAAACKETRLSVGFSLPVEYRAEVDHIEVSAYRPTEVNPFSCDDIAFGDDVGEPDQRLFVETSETVHATIDRVGEKRVVIRALDPAGGLVAAGCTEVGDLEEETHVAVGMEPASLVEIGFSDPYSPLEGKDLPDEILLHTMDVLDEDLAGVDVRVTLLQGVWSVDNGLATEIHETDANGQLVIYPADIHQPGPTAIDVEPRWARKPVDRIVGAAPAPMVPLPPLAGYAYGYVSGRVGDRGESGFAAILVVPRDPPVDPPELDFYVERWACIGDPPELQQVRRDLVDPGVLGIQRGRTADRVFVIAEHGDEVFRTNIGPTGPEAPIFYPKPEPELAPMAVFQVGTCPPTDDEQPMLVWFVSIDDNNPRTRVRVYGTEDHPLDGLDDQTYYHILGSGCLPLPEGQQVRAVAHVDAALATPESYGTFLTLPYYGGGHSTLIPELFPQIGFLRRPTGEGPLLAVQDSPTGSAVLRVGFDRVGTGTLLARTLARDPIPGNVAAMAGGRIDADDIDDLVTLIYMYELEFGTLLPMVHLVYGVQRNGRRLAGLWSLEGHELGLPGGTPFVAVGDFSCDGHERDILVAQQHEFDAAPEAPPTTNVLLLFTSPYL